MGLAKVYAKFDGRNKSLGYQKGKKYHLNFVVLENGQIEISVENFDPKRSEEEPCVYSTLHSFLANWKVLG